MAKSELKLPIGREFSIAFILLLFTGCASSPLPENYSGATAIIRDSVVPINNSRAKFFWVSKVDGRTIESSPEKTRIENYGRGLNMQPKIVERKVAAQKLTVRIEAGISFAADILALTNKSYAVGGEVELKAEPNKVYVVKGTISPETSSVWIEEAATGKVVSAKIDKVHK